MTEEKSGFHTRNKHRNQYDFKQLIEINPELGKHVKINKFGNESIDFFNPNAVKALNKALLSYFYGIKYWDIPSGYLTPPVPGRADYIHHVADLLTDNYASKNRKGNKIRCLDIGVGANCIYPIIGSAEYGWDFVGTDIDLVSIEVAEKIIKSNPLLKEKIELRYNNNANNIFEGIIMKDEYFDISVCNPPFHKSATEAKSGALRKLSNLHKKSIKNPTLNFGGQSNEIWCVGGEKRFIKNMILESKKFAKSCFWFTTLVSKEAHLFSIYGLLDKVGALEVKTITMNQGNKKSRIVAWSFFKIMDNLGS